MKWLKIRLKKIFYKTKNGPPYLTGDPFTKKIN